MTEIIPHILAALTGLVALIGAWLKLRVDTREKPEKNETVVALRQYVRGNPHEFDFGSRSSNLKTAVAVGLGAAAGVEAIHAASELLSHHGPDVPLADGFDLLL